MSTQKAFQNLIAPTSINMSNPRINKQRGRGDQYRDSWKSFILLYKSLPFVLFSLSTVFQFSRPASADGFANQEKTRPLIQNDATLVHTVVCNGPLDNYGFVYFRTDRPKTLPWFGKTRPSETRLHTPIWVLGCHFKKAVKSKALLMMKCVHDWNALNCCLWFPLVCVFFLRSFFFSLSCALFIL